MSATIDWITGCSAIGFPNWTRSRACRVASSSAPCAIPTACAAQKTRFIERVFMRLANPSPSSPMRFSAGTFISSKNSSELTDPRIPIFDSFRP